MAVGSGTNREPRTHLPWRGESSKCGGSGHTVVVVQPNMTPSAFRRRFGRRVIFFMNSRLHHRIRREKLDKDDARDGARGARKHAGWSF